MEENYTPQHRPDPTPGASRGLVLPTSSPVQVAGHPGLIPTGHPSPTPGSDLTQTLGSLGPAARLQELALPRQ